MKKIICFVISAVIILSGLNFAFADEPEEDSASSSGTSASFDDQLRSLSVQLAATTTYTADDIYDLLNQCTVLYLNQLCLRVFDPGTTNAINSQGSSINSYLRSIDDFISGWYNNYLVYNDGSSNYSSVQLLYNLSVALDQINSNTSSSYSTDPSLYDQVSYILQNTITGLISDNANHDPYLYLINQDTSNIKNQLVYDNKSVAQHLYNISSAITTTNNTLANIKSDTTSIANNTRNLVSDLGSSGAISSGISSLQSDFNNISWTGFNSTIQYSKDLNGEFLDLPDTNYVSVTRGDIYFSFTRPYNIDQNTVYRFVVPLQSSTTSTKNLIKNISFYNNGDYLYPNFYYSYNQYNSLVIVYVYNLLWYSGNMIIHFDTSITNRVRPLSVTGDYQIYEIQDSFSDYYTVCHWINQNYQANILRDFKELYASDDLIAAKENQQSYEDQVVSDFTGSGSAAAKASDAASAKDISSAVSSGLNSGGSVNNSLSVFNPSGGFWGWFSQENSDLINTLSSQNRLRSSGFGGNWVEDDPYQRNAEELQSFLGGER